MRYTLPLLLLTSCPTAPLFAQFTPEQLEFFEARVRPVLVEKCYACHGDKKQRAGLRVDSRAELVKGSENGPVVVPGDPDKSLLVRAIQHRGDTRMPPQDKLPAPAIEALTAWVKMGLPWPEPKARVGVPASAGQGRTTHWAFQPVRKPAAPAKIDAFIQDSLRRAGVTSSAPADRRTLIRRATFDLIGLPPTPAEVAAFEADPSPLAFAKVVDRLLASPHYGERWGRYWLDVARYADTKGYVFLEDSEYPFAFTYRDYVIRAFNEDMPYDQFIVQQLAADQLIEPGREASWPLAAMGFLTAGGRFMNNRHDIIDDRIDVVTRGLMGLTVTCARCHDHKYDPVPTADYYSLYGVFASCYEPPVPPLLDAPPVTEAYAKFDKELQAREQKLNDFVQTKYRELVTGAKTRVAEYLLTAQAQRDQPDQENFMLLSNTEDLNPTMIQRFKVFLDRTEKNSDPVFVPWHALTSLPEKDLPAASAKLCAGFEQDQRVNPLIARALAESPPKTYKELAAIYSRVLNEADRGAAGDAATVALLQVFRAPNAPPAIKVSPIGDLALLPDRPSQAKQKELLKALEEWRAKGPGAVPRAMTLRDLPEPHNPRVFRRGNPGNQADPVPRQFPGVLAGEQRKPFTQGSGRLELARAIADPANPLTARVLVNRVWLHHFGAGLVRTPSDFGLRSDPPSHPELLDFLAASFIDNGWSIKKLHRMIMLSDAYQQRSDDREECMNVDPENRLLWKMNRRRLDFEALRDSYLAVAGRLEPTIGGPAQKNILAADTRRRTLYGFIDRLNLSTLYRAFDFPSPDASSPERSVTTVPQQALFLMNNAFSLACARNVLHRADIAAVDADEKIDRLYRLLFGRGPSVEEQQLGRAFVTTPDLWPRYTQALMLTNEFAFID